jgi:hypothetical protein
VPYVELISVTRVQQQGEWIERKRGAADSVGEVILLKIYELCVYEHTQLARTAAAAQTTTTTTTTTTNNNNNNNTGHCLATALTNDNLFVHSE